jgi:hypothetical protein
MPGITAVTSDLHTVESEWEGEAIEWERRALASLARRGAHYNCN